MGSNGLLQDNITFGKGMMPQIDPINLPEGAYLDALNMIRNEVGVLSTECGTSAIVNSIPGTIVGIVNAGDVIVVCSTDGTTSYIGSISTDDTYTIICSNNILKFNTSTKLSLEYKEDYKKDKILYIGGKGVKLRRVNLSTITSVQLLEFDRTTSLFLEYQLPITKVLRVQSGGNVPTGIYQFACRLVTDSGDVTGFGILSGLFPVLSSNREESEDVKNIDGAQPQTKSTNLLSLELSNIDKAFKYVEPCVVTYTGQSNILKVRSLGLKVITSDKMYINYSGVEDESKELLEEDIAVGDARYTTGNYLAQKDSTLLIAGVTETVDDYPWQEVANSIIVKWGIFPLVHSEPIVYNTQPDNNTLGSDTGVSSTFSSYRNPENHYKYAGYKRGEVYSFAFSPIVNGKVGKAFHIPAMNLGEASKIFPDTSQLTDVAYTSDNIKYPQDFADLYSGDSIKNTPVRYHKMPDHDVSPFMRVKDSGQDEFHNVLYLDFTITSTENWKDNCDGYIISRESRVGKETRGAQGIVKRFYRYTDGKYGIIPGINSMRITGTDTVDFQLPEQIDQNNFLFCAPDYITNSNSLSYTPSTIVGVRGEEMDRVAFTYGNGINDKRECKEVFSRVTGNTLPAVTTSEISLSPTTTYISPQGNNNPMMSGSNVPIPSHTALDILVMRTTGGIIMSTESQPMRQRITPLSFWHDDSNTDAYSFQGPSVGYIVDLYELGILSTDYYGDIYNKEVFTVSYRLKKDFRTTETISCFGGDTYISKYAMVIKDGPAHYGKVQDSDNQSVPYSSHLVYITVESQYNYFYRHYVLPTETVKGSTPYYPKQKNFETILTSDLTLGNAELYNKQYSAQNNLQKSYTATVDEFVVTEFSNRVVYSGTSIDGEKSDSYRLFKINSFHDIPKQYGNITGIFTQGTDLYIHSEKALWKAFYNTLVTQATSVGDVVLGNGGAFSRPSVPVVSLQGGYAGCKDISASIGTPLGRFFYDFTKAKLYLLGEGLQEVSNPAVFDLLRTTIGSGDVSLGYDYGRKRVLLSSSFGTLSFKPELQSFDSRHDYKFSHFISRELKDYMVLGSNVHFFDKTKVGTFFNVVYNSFLKVASVINPSFSKRYVSGEIILTAQNPITKVNDPWAFFKTLKVYSRERNTGQTTFKVNPSFGEIEQFGQILVSKANNKFRFGFAPDIVDDINLDIQDPYNLKSHARFTDSDRIFLPDMVDNHVILEFTIDNNQQKEIKIQSLIINFDQNIT